MSSLLTYAVIIAVTYATKDSLMDPKKYVKIYSQCDPTPDSPIHQNNGLYYIKPTEEGPVIPAICSNGFTMIDPSLDTNLKAYPSYLSSYDYSRGSTEYIITNLDDTSTFRDWWLPASKSTKFRTARRCLKCEPSIDPLLQDKVVYYTDSSLFAYTSYIGEDACADQKNEYACNTCDVGQYSPNYSEHIRSSHWQKCTALQSDADTPSWHEPQMRVNHHLIYRPVMSMIREACTCYQQQNSDDLLREYSVPIASLPEVTHGNSPIKADQDVTVTVDYIDPMIKLNDIHQCDPTLKKCDIDLAHRIKCENTKVYLTQQDFAYGTYRIRECGEYIFAEDITVDFNPPSANEQSSADFSPNRIDIDDMYWFPTKAQSEKKGDYPGLYDFIGSFALGFFTGITVESNDVVINLNGFSFEMAKKFYLQQRFFSLIEMAAKMFEPLQGPNAWGLYNEVYANNLEIKGPGTLGLTSHHGIHGNRATNLNIHDLDVKNFDVAGISCNACQFVKIESVSVGPQNQNIPVLGRYTHARAFLPRLKHLNDHFGDQTIKFYNRKQTTVRALCERYVAQMDMMYFHIIKGQKYSDSDPEWAAAQKIFRNPTGWMDGGSSYGVTINGRGAAVVGIGVRTGEVDNIIMKNVEIFGIYNQAIEKIKFQLPKSDEKNPTLTPATTRGILFDAIDWIAVTDQISDRKQSQYIGDVYTDVQFAAAKFVDSWYYRNSYFVGQRDVDYVFKGNTAEMNYPFLDILPVRTDYWNDPITRSCGTDIQLHSSKGAIGLMVNGAKDSVFDNIHIHNVYNWAELGSKICGPYDQIHITFEDIDIQYGYTATRAHGMVIDYVTGDYTNIKINDIESRNGEANGLTIYKESYVNLQNIKVNRISAGTKLSEAEIDEIVLPNFVPRACSVDIYDNTEVSYLGGGTDEDNLMFENINGYIVCDPFEKSDERLSVGLVRRGVWKLIRVPFILSLLFVCVVLLVYCKPGLRKTGTDNNNEQTPLLHNENQNQNQNNNDFIDISDP